MKRALLLASLVAAPATLHAQTPARPTDGTGTLYGVITERSSRDPLPGAMVVIVGTSLGAVSDVDGKYEVRGLRPGRYTVQITHIGHDPHTVQNVDVRANQRRELSAALRESAVSSDEVIVTSPDRPVVQADVTGSSASRNATGRAAEPSQSQTWNHAPPPPPPPQIEPTVRVAPNYPVPSDHPGQPPVYRYHHPRPDPSAGEDYKSYRDASFQAPFDAPYSTFAVDVDRASYANVRRFLTQGQAPPRDAVRVEEMVNYFAYTYPQPRGTAPLAVHTEVGAAPWAPQHRLVRVGVQAKRIDLDEAPASNLVFLLDVSGSMGQPNKLPLVQQAMRMLTNELRPQDRVSIVVYAGAAGLVLPSTSGRDKDAILAAIDQLHAGGSTAGGAGIQLAYDVARDHFIRGGNNRVILATDGDFNVGLSSEEQLVRLIEQRRQEGTFLTVLGVGQGNLQDREMEALSNKGNGNYAYLDNLLEARRALVTEMGGTLYTVAKDVKVQVEFNPSRVAAYRLVGYENRALEAWEFNDDRRDGGEVGSGHTVTALYEIVPVGVPLPRERGVDPLRYQRPTPRAATANGSDELLFVKVRYQSPEGGRSSLIEHPVADRVASLSVDGRFAASVAAFAMLLRESPHRGTASSDLVLSLARTARGEDADGYRAEFIRLVETWQSLGLDRARNVSE